MAAEKNENSYRNILKGTSIFGGVQIFQILINLIRGKFVAMLLGPEGMGFSSIFTSSSNVISQFASLGLNLAFVKEVAANKERPSTLAHVLYVAGILIRLTALAGALVCLVMSPWLSVWSFGSGDYTWQFMLLSVAVFLAVSSVGQASLLQGMHRMKILSLTSLTGAITGLVAGVPLYYFFGTRGIVPAMIVLGLTTCGFYTYGLRKATGQTRIKFDRATHMPMIRRMLSIGIILLAASLINTTFTYLINIFIRTHGDIADVGLFNAANSITMQYAGVVFTAMALDYFPRLTAAAGDMKKMGVIINRQMVIVALIATPLSILLVATAPIVIRLLLTPEFMPVTGLMRWLGISILLKAIAYPLGYITFANNNRRLFFWLEAIVCNVLYITLSLIFYYYYGLDGLGYAAVAEQSVCILLYLGVNYKVYGFRPGRRAWTETLLAVLLGAAGFCATLTASETLSYYLISVVFIISAARSFVMLRSLISRNEE